MSISPAHRCSLALALWAAASLHSAFAAETTLAAGPIDDAAYLRPQQRVAVEPGRHLNLFCTGQGAVTVLLESGLTDETSAWERVQAPLSSRHRVCSYDRAGVGFSDPATHASSPRDIADDLERLMAKAGLQPPFIVVAHSYGAYPARLFASRHPEAVRGLVLVDPSHELKRDMQGLLDPRGLSPEDWIDRTETQPLALRKACLALAERGLAEGSEEAQRCGFPADRRYSPAINAVHRQQGLGAAFQAAQWKEQRALYGSAPEQLAQEQRDLGAMPLIVLTARPAVPAPDAPNAQALQQRRLVAGFMASFHRQYLRLSRQAQQRIVEPSGHDMHFDQPQAVIQAVEDVVALSTR